MNNVEWGALPENTALGIELGSTRIKAVLVGPEGRTLASGSCEWENKLENGFWTYGLDEVWEGLRACYRALNEDVRARYGAKLARVGAIGISAMMHGYLVFDEKAEMLTPFRTWRNTTTDEAAQKLSALLKFNMPQRWSAAHLYQAILNDEPHVPRIAYLTTLAGYVHWKLTGEKVLGVGDASGMFPIDSRTGDYDAGMLRQFDELIAPKGYPWKAADILPRVLPAGAGAGILTKEGAALLDETGTLQPGLPLCPPEGDAGTGMVATNSVAKRTGNISAGTSIFAMIVLERALKAPYPEIDMVTTPDGKPVAMAHANNCTSDLNAWVNLFAECLDAMGAQADKNRLFGVLFNKALEGEPDGGGLLAFNYYAGEPVTGLNEGRPLFARLPDSRLSLANFMRAHLYAALATLKIGMDILIDKENVRIDRIVGHGGFFKTPVVGQRLMAGALNAPVTVMETASEG
ncbi:MAG TPA: FGGY-family carbohydrate kinase, partial [Clostridia bacterium]|nr:FGGY-family carbohydrate kinase [Clostridia bacterium]